jgi:NAD(P)-dependent dehydrogenase (short-subunit alcohol dehydrogenase family)
MPTLIANAPSRIVVVSSTGHRLVSKIKYQQLDGMNSQEKNAGQGWGTLTSYGESKLANVLFARALASRYGAQQVTAYSLHPGVMDTALMFSSRLVKNLSILEKRKSLAQGAATTVYCTLKSGLENENGRYFDDSSVTSRADKFTDTDVDELWNWTEKVIRERTASF